MRAVGKPAMVALMAGSVALVTLLIQRFATDNRRLLEARRGLTIVTNSLMAAATLMTQPHRLILVGGEFRALWDESFQEDHVRAVPDDDVTSCVSVLSRANLTTRRLCSSGSATFGSLFIQRSTGMARTRHSVVRAKRIPAAMPTSPQPSQMASSTPAI